MTAARANRTLNEVTLPASRRVTIRKATRWPRAPWRGDGGAPCEQRDEAPDKYEIDDLAEVALLGWLCAGLNEGGGRGRRDGGPYDLVREGVPRSPDRLHGEGPREPQLDWVLRRPAAAKVV